MRGKTGKSGMFGTGIVISASIHVLLLGLLALGIFFKGDKPPPPFREVEFIDVTPVDGSSSPGEQPPAPEPPKPEPPKPEPPAPEPPKPEPPKPEPPKPEPPKPEPPKPEPPKPEPPKPEPPKPKPVEKPKPPEPPKQSRQDRLKERLAQAESTKVPSQPSKPQRPRPDTARELERRIDQSVRRSGHATISRPTGNPNPALSGVQLTAYDNYLVSCLQPAMQRIWDQVAPSNLSTPPRNAQVTLMVDPQGRILSGYLSAKSDSAQMNDAAMELLNRMKQVRLQPFSTVGLPGNAALRFVVNLQYKIGG